MLFMCSFLILLMHVFYAFYTTTVKLHNKLHFNARNSQLLKVIIFLLFLTCLVHSHSRGRLFSLLTKWISVLFFTIIHSLHKELYIPGGGCVRAALHHLTTHTHTYSPHCSPGINNTNSHHQHSCTASDKRPHLYSGHRLVTTSVLCTLQAAQKFCFHVTDFIGSKKEIKLFNSYFWNPNFTYTSRTSKRILNWILKW